MPILGPGTALDQAALDRVLALAQLYAGARERLEEIERELRGGTYRRAYLERQIREASAVIDELLVTHGEARAGAVAVWATEAVPAAYGLGARMALADLSVQGMTPIRGAARTHTAAVEALLDRYLDDATEIMVRLKGNLVRATRLVIAQAGLGEEIAAGMIGGLPRRETSKLIRRRLEAAVRAELPEGAVIDLTHVELGKRRMRVDVYAEMHARTETARASTAGTRVLSSTNGVRHVQVTSHSHSPCICTPFEGRIFALDRGDPRFPHVSTMPGGGCPMHPNCVHREAPAVLAFLEARGELEGRDEIPADFRGRSPRELAQLVRRHKAELATYAEARDGMMPTDFQLKRAA